MRVVYLDMVMAVNFVMDVFLLWLTGRLARQKTPLLRLVLASLIGSMYFLLVLFPPMKLHYSWGTKLVISLLMVSVAFRPANWPSFLRLTALFYVVSFGVGGAILALFSQRVFTTVLGVFFERNSPSLAWWILPIGLLLFAVLLALGKRYLRSRITAHFYPVQIKLGEQTVCGTAFVDTGNALRDPLTKKAVAVADYDLLSPLFPGTIQEVLARRPEEGLAIPAEKLSREWITRLRLVPYRGIGGQDGVLWGFRPDSFFVQKGEVWQTIDGAIIGINQGTLSADGHYQMLLHPEMISP